MLLGQNVNSYGKTSPGEISFAELLGRVNQIDGSTAHSLHDVASPGSLAGTDRSVRHSGQTVRASAFAGAIRCGFGLVSHAPWLHDVRNISAAINRLRKRCANIALSTDIIVGFPGETDAEFANTLEMLRQVEYDEIFSFMYSPRPQTVSAKIYDDDIAEDVKKARLQEVQSLQREISLKKNRESIGNVEEILVDGKSRLKNGQIMGRTRS